MKNLVANVLVYISILFSTMNVRAIKIYNTVRKIAITGVTSSVVSGVVCASLSAIITHSIMKNKLEESENKLEEYEKLQHEARQFLLEGLY